eukprot:13220795-Alexandrium_andersonii.AAC.1
MSAARRPSSTAAAATASLRRSPSGAMSPGGGRVRVAAWSRNSGPRGASWCSCLSTPTAQPPGSRGGTQAHRSFGGRSTST